MSVSNDMGAVGDQAEKVAADAVRHDCDQFGEGDLLAIVDEEAGSVSVYEIFAEEGSGDRSQVIQHMERVFERPTETLDVDAE